MPQVPTDDGAMAVQARRADNDERRRELTHSLHNHASSSLLAQVVRLQEQAAAYRAQAIAFNARLVMHQHERGELRALRDQLAESSARLARAVDGIDALTSSQQQLASLRP